MLGGIAALDRDRAAGRVRARAAAPLRIALGLLAAVPVLGLLVAQTDVHRLDEWLYQAINGFGPGPEWLWTLLDPHTRNYIVLIGSPSSPAP